MKTNYWLVLGTLAATAAVAQVDTNSLPAIPAPASAAAPATMEPVVTNAPAAEPVKKKAPVKKKVVKKLNEPTVSLTAGPATVASPNLNVRGQAGLKGEVIERLKQGESVMVISQINLDKHALDEPAQWAKIALPSATDVWISALFVDAATKTVKASKLNLRAGPSENYSVLGVIRKGESFTEITRKNGWIQIQPPANAFAYVAAMYLKQEPAQVVAVTPVVVPPPQPAVVPEPAPVVAQPTLAPVEPALAPPSIPTELDTNLPPRVVSHQGVVRSSGSPVAPTPYEIYNPESGVTVNYLYSSAKDLDLSRYAGMEIIVTGEEGIAPRWGATPVISIQKIFVVTSSPSEPAKISTSPRGVQNTPRGQSYKRR